MPLPVFAPQGDAGHLRRVPRQRDERGFLQGKVALRTRTGGTARVRLWLLRTTRQQLPPPRPRAPTDLRAHRGGLPGPGNICAARATGVALGSAGSLTRPLQGRRGRGLPGLLWSCCREDREQIACRDAAPDCRHGGALALVHWHCRLAHLNFVAGQEDEAPRGRVPRGR